MISNGRQRRTHTPIPAIVFAAALICCMVFQFAGCSSDDPPPSSPPKEEKVFDLTVTKGTNTAPLLHPIGDKIAYVGVPFSLTLSALDTPDDILTYDFYPVDLPNSEGKKYKLNTADGTLIMDPDTGLPIVDWPDETAVFNPTSRTFSWTPQQAGDYYFKATVADDGVTIMSASEFIRIRVCSVSVANESLAISLNTNDPNEPANLTLNMIAKTQTSGVPINGLSPQDFDLTDDTFFSTGSEWDSAERRFEILPATTDVLLLLDLSGSIMDDGIDGMTELKTSTKKFVDYVLASGQSIAIYYFNSDADIQEIIDFQVVQPYGKNLESVRQQLHGKLNSLERYVEENDSSNLYGAIIKGIATLDKRAVDAATKVGSLVVFSDGRDTAGRKKYSDALTAVTGSKHNVITVGINIANTDRTREDRLIIDEQRALGKNGAYMTVDKSELIKQFSQAAFAARLENLKSYILAFCLTHRDGIHSLTVSVKDASGNVPRYGTATISYSAAKFEGGCYTAVEKEKVKYFDFDSDSYYSVPGKLHDCNDLDPYNWIHCDDCIDQDGDGYGGSGCDINSDCSDDLEKEPYADLINPNMADTTEDGWDQNCDGLDGRR